MSAQIQPVQRPRVLFIDDEPRVLNSMRIMFRREYDLYFAADGRDALKTLAAHDIDVIVCDHRMPRMTGVELLTRAKEVSPRSVRILLTGYADLSAVEGSINEGEVFRFLTKPCAPDVLKETVRLAVDLALDPEANPAAYAAQDDAAVEETSTEPSAPAEPTGFAGTGTDVLDKPAVLVPGQSRKPAPNRRRKPAAGMSVLVFSSDEDIYDVVVEATMSRIPVYRAGNIVQVVKILDEHRPGVLLTDISEDKSTIQAMTARLKQHLPQLVTIAVSEHRDVLDMVWLINHGQIFRFLRKPLSPGRCAVSLKAALQHHQTLLRNPALIKRHTVETSGDAGFADGVLARLKFLTKLWSRG